jgi:hypothetical protein
MFVSPGYFQAMGIRLRKGRVLNEADMNPSEQLLLVVAAQAAVNRYWPNRDPANPFPIPISHFKWLVGVVVAAFGTVASLILRH